jgi:copper chaperone CopZ
MCDTTASNDLGLTDANSSCSCSTHDHAANEAAPAGESAVSAEYFVTGMTCSHCVASVSEELAAVPGVDGVSVDLNVGGASRVTVASERSIETEAVRAAIEEAGYTLADAH